MHSLLQCVSLSAQLLLWGMGISPSRQRAKKTLPGAGPVHRRWRGVGVENGMAAGTSGNVLPHQQAWLQPLAAEGCYQSTQSKRIPRSHQTAAKLLKPWCWGKTLWLHKTSQSCQKPWPHEETEQMYLKCPTSRPFGPWSCLQTHYSPRGCANWRHI